MERHFIEPYCVANLRCSASLMMLYEETSPSECFEHGQRSYLHFFVRAFR
jgi:hypothetical protein